MPYFQFTQYILRLFLATTLVGLSSVCFAASSPSQIMSKAMLAMMDTLGTLAYQFKNNWPSGNTPHYEWPGYTIPQFQGIYNYPRSYFPAQVPYPYALPPQYQQRTPSKVDGIWAGRGGEIVLVMYGHFRIYANPELYRDGRYHVDGNKLLMYDPESGRTQEYDYLLDKGRMIMRDKYDNILLFKQLPIPLPTYPLPPSAN
jgi:hypothetical protein